MEIHVPNHPLTSWKETLAHLAIITAGVLIQDVVAFGRRLGAADRPTDEAVQRWRANIDIAIAGIVYREQIARQLQKRDAEMLGPR